MALARRPRLLAYVALETFSVLTRLPPPHRAPPQVVADFLRASFPEAPVSLPGTAQLALLSTAASAGIAGGAIYDALVAATARHSGATLLTRDRRAIPTYEILAVRYEMLG